MRRPILTALFLFGGTMANAQMVQYGKVTEMSSGGKCLNGVAITVNSTHDCQPTISDAHGVFRLCFGEHQTGDVVMGIHARKSGYEVVNSHFTRDGWTLTPKDSLKIVMAPAAKLSEARMKYYDLVETACISRFDQTKAFLHEQFMHGELSDNEYEYWMAAAQTELQRAYGEMEDYAEWFACINTDDMNDITRQIYGKLESDDTEGAMALVAGDSYNTVLQAYNGLKLMEPMEEQEIMVAASDSITVAETVSEDILSVQSYVGMMEDEFAETGKRYAKACAYLGGLFKDAHIQDKADEYLEKSMKVYGMLEMLGKK